MTSENDIPIPQEGRATSADGKHTTRMTGDPLNAAREELRAGVGEWWDADDSMADDYVRSLPQGRFVVAVHAFDPSILCWLTYFTARRALPCWELTCSDDRPRVIVDALGRHLREGVDLKWGDGKRATRSPHRDCLYSETQSASDAVAEAARYIHDRNPLNAIYCISGADTAYHHVLVNDCFRQWLIDVAIPVAVEKREMTPAEQEALRGRGKSA
jgi:hypothetical protein